MIVDERDTSFNKAFSKAWFLHLYIDKDGETQNSVSRRLNNRLQKYRIYAILNWLYKLSELPEA